MKLRITHVRRAGNYAAPLRSHALPTACIIGLEHWQFFY